MGDKLSRLTIILLSIVLGTAVATQRVAYSYGYSEALPGRLFLFGGHPVYGPWSILRWWNLGLSDEVKHESLLILGMFWALPIFSFWVREKVSHKVKAQSAHGTAAWGDWRTLQESKLLSASGVVLGKTANGEILRDDSEAHVAVLGRTGSGKSVGVSIPTLFDTSGSVFVLDAKGELFRETAGIRERFSRTIYFNPASMQTHRYNPLSQIRSGPHLIKDSQAVADMLMDPHGQGMEGHDEFWKSNGRAFLTGLILYVLQFGTNKTLNGVRELLNSPGQNVEQILKTMIACKDEGDSGAEIALSGQKVLNMASDTRNDVMATASQKFDLFGDPMVRYATSESDFRIEEFLTGARPISFYFAIPASDFDRLRPIVRLMITQILRRLVEPYDASESRHKMLFLLDEFHLLGRLEFLETGFALVRGFGVRFLLLTQSVNQLEKAYGRNHSILENTGIQLFFTPSTIESAEMLSKTLGRRTADYVAQSSNVGLFSGLARSRSVSEHWTGRELLTADEARRIPDEAAVLLMSGKLPIYCGKVRSFADKHYIGRRVPPSPLPYVPCRVEELMTVVGEATLTVEGKSSSSGTKKRKVM